MGLVKGARTRDFGIRLPAPESRLIHAVPSLQDWTAKAPENRVCAPFLPTYASWIPEALHVSRMRPTDVAIYFIYKRVGHRASLVSVLTFTHTEHNKLCQDTDIDFGKI
jgi:hypothetical protein